VEEPYDIAIAGAGPAGAIAAYTAAKRGLRVALIDRQTFPRDKPCGDGIGPGAVAIASQLGLGGIFANDVPVSAVTVYGPDGAQLDTATADMAAPSTAASCRARSSTNGWSTAPLKKTPHARGEAQPPSSLHRAGNLVGGGDVARHGLSSDGGVLPFEPGGPGFSVPVATITDTLLRQRRRRAQGRQAAWAVARSAWARRACTAPAGLSEP
jgi:hypothetical protein